MKHALAPWLEAVRTLADNPWLGYLRLIERRRVTRLPLWRRSFFLIAALTVALCVLLAELLSSGGPRLSALIPDSLLLLTLLGGLWLLGQFGRASAACLSLLAQRQGRALSGQFDDSIALGELTDQQFIVGTLAHVLPRIWLGIAIAGGLLWYWNALTAGWDGPPYRLLPGGPTLELVVRQGAWLWLSFILNGVLASTILGFILIAVGRCLRLAVSLPLVNTALLTHIVGHSVTMLLFTDYYFLSAVVNLGLVQTDPLIWCIWGPDPSMLEPIASTGMEGPLSHLFSIIALLVLVAVALRAGLRAPAWRNLLLPLVLLPLPLYLLNLEYAFYRYSSYIASHRSEWAEYMAPWWLIGLGVLNPLDPLAFQLPVPLLAGEAWPWPRETLYWPLQFGAQVVLMVLTASLAARSVRLSRSGE